jgi:hypothetical protein
VTERFKKQVFTMIFTEQTKSYGFKGRYVQTKLEGSTELGMTAALTLYSFGDKQHPPELFLDPAPPVTEQNPFDMGPVPRRFRMTVEQVCEECEEKKDG